MVSSFKDWFAIKRRKMSFGRRVKDNTPARAQVEIYLSRVLSIICFSFSWYALTWWSPSLLIEILEPTANMKQKVCSLVYVFMIMCVCNRKESGKFLQNTFKTRKEMIKQELVQRYMYLFIKDHVHNFHKWITIRFDLGFLPSFWYHVKSFDLKV